MTYDFAVVGAGIVGLATAFRLLEARPGSKVAVLEKETAPGRHQSGNNSGVLHAGLYYRPGSRKARLAAEGLRQMVAFCREHNLPHEQCGKIVVATSSEELPRLDTLWERGHANGLTGLRRLGPDQIREIEPHAAGLAGIQVPQEGIVDYPAVCRKLGELITAGGGEIHVATEIRRLVRDGQAWALETTKGDLRALQVVACAGLHADHLVRRAGGTPEAQIIPFRGEYYSLKPERLSLVRHLIYPVPNPTFPFLGVHFTRLVHGGVEAGPNAVLAFAREGYRMTDVNPRDLAECLAFPGLWRFLAKYPRIVAYELYRSFSRAEFCRSLQRLVPDIREADLGSGGAGVRAQAMHRDGTLVEDFEFVEEPGLLHVINAPSPAATASLAIGAVIRDKLLQSS